MSTNDHNRISVEIYGIIYKLKSNSSERYIKKVAEHVNEQMHRIAKSYPRLDVPRLAVLAAIYMADEYFKINDELSNALSETSVMQKLKETVNKIQDENLELREHCKQVNQEHSSLQKALEQSQQRQAELEKELLRLQQEAAAAIEEAEAARQVLKDREARFQVAEMTWKHENDLMSEKLHKNEQQQFHSEQEFQAIQQRMEAEFAAAHESMKQAEEQAAAAKEKETQTDSYQELLGRFEKLSIEYAKLQKEYNEWIEIVGHDM